VPKLLLVRFAIIVIVVQTIDLIDVHGCLVSQVGVNLTGILFSLFRNAMAIAIIVIKVMFAFSEIGSDIVPLIASAGVFRLAIGFGAQKVVQDIITGIFSQFENTMNVGDVVNVCCTTGSVEWLTICSVSLRDVHGAFHIIPFSSIDMVTNFMREFGQYVSDMGITCKGNVDDAKVVMTDAFEELRADGQWGQLNMVWRHNV